jgi:hypothetical protein
MITEQTIGEVFALLGAVAGLVMGVLCLFFTDKFNQLQIKYASKQNDAMNQRIARELSRSYIKPLTKLIGLLFVIFFGLTLIQYL